MNDKDYYRRELKTLQHSKDYFKTVQVCDGLGVATRELNLNLDSIPVLIGYLKAEKKRLQGIDYNSIIGLKEEKKK